MACSPSSSTSGKRFVTPRRGCGTDQARRRPTPSGLTLGGLVKHLADAERGWIDRVAGLPPVDASFDDYMASFVLTDDETLVGVLEPYEEASARTDEEIESANDLGRRVPRGAKPAERS